VVVSILQRIFQYYDAIKLNKITSISFYCENRYEITVFLEMI
jgi:hypothetical protein